ncbi:MAG: DUF6498-containing protein [Patescibacteria group bacterium]
MKTISNIFAVFSLLVSNLIPLFGVIYFHWNVFSLMVLYWLENVLIGVFTVQKMKRAEAGNLDSVQAERSFFIPFFTIHFGMFTLVHGIFVLIFFYSPEASLWGIFLTFLSMCLSHFISYQTNYLGRGEYLHTSVERLFISPYPRVIVMHLTVILGGFFVLSNHSVYALVILVILKTLADLGSHLFEHRLAEARIGNSVGFTGKVKSK